MDSTIFEGDKFEACSKILLEAGYNYEGKDLLMSGVSGTPI